MKYYKTSYPTGHLQENLISFMNEEEEIFPTKKRHNPAEIKYEKFKKRNSRNSINSNNK